MGAAPHIAIVGGGTAGWLAAHMLRRLAESEQVTCRISVIEDPDTPTIGVGEGTTSVFRQVLLDLGFDEFEFMRETGATIKYGIRHIGWSGAGSEYLGPIDDPHQLDPDPTGQNQPWLHCSAIASGQSVFEANVFTPLMRRARAPWVRKGQEWLPVSAYHHAYHFDQAKVGAYLRRKASGIAQVSAKVIGFDQNDGHITRLICQDHPDLDVDFVFDCTGFRRALIGQLDAGWRGYGALLPLNRAMPFWVDHADGDIAPYTTARAMTAGWMWQIPTVDRMGCGYVYSEAHISADEAQREVEALLGQPIEPRADIAVNAGRLARPWVGNCVALGLCQSFLEPLEATSIHGTVVQLMMLGQGGFLPKLAGRVGGLDLLRRAYCDVVNTQIDDFAEFINLHYTGGRRDTPFWTEMTEMGISERNRDLIDRLKHGLPQDSDFPDLPGQLPHLQRALYLPVLDGLSLMDKAPCKAILSQSHGLAQRARELRQSNRKEFLKAAGQAVGHRAFLSDIAQGA